MCITNKKEFSKMSYSQSYPHYPQKKKNIL